MERVRGFKDLKGMRFGKLTVVGEGYKPLGG